ncbi:hypothetical protein CCACVL1_24204, partial [Corchorus capsularis]
MIYKGVVGDTSLEDLKSYTDNFSQDNFIEDFQFCKVYRGKIEDYDIIVKVYCGEIGDFYTITGLWRLKNEILPEEHRVSFQEEIKIKSHPGLAKMTGYCVRGQRAILYDLNPVDTLRSFVINETYYGATIIPKEIVEISFEDLKSYTDNFSEDNFIGNFQFGEVYRGKIEDHDVTVKVWMQQTLYVCFPGNNEHRMDNELVLHADSRIRSHPNLAKLIGYCHEGGQLAVVYDLNPVDTLRNFILRDDFTWLQRIKIALQLACLLQFLHIPSPPHKRYVVRNIEAAHFFLDKDYNLVLYEFSMFSGGCLRERLGYPFIKGCFGYIDPDMHNAGPKGDPIMDVFAFESFSPNYVMEEISFEDLKSYTNNFSEDNFIGNFQFGKVYRGKIGDHDVTVKVWMAQTFYVCLPGDNENRMEVCYPRIKSHPNLAKLIGYCREGQLAVVYDLNPVDTLRTISLRGILVNDFTWLQRIKTALQLARLLQFLQTPCPPYEPYLICNIDAAHFVLDKDYNLVLYDFSMFSGGFVPEMKDYRGCPLIFGCFGYIDPYIYNRT